MDSDWRPGSTAVAVDAVARRVITDAGYPSRYGHGLGHGIGLEVHELPSLRYYRADTFEAGMVFSVEPGIYQPGRDRRADRGHRGVARGERTALPDECPSGALVIG